MRCVLFISGLVGFLLLSTANAIVINVPADYPTIEAGINASVNGDTVLVAPGTFQENVNFNGHSIVLASNFIVTCDTSQISSTIIDGRDYGATITINQGEDSTTHIMGLSITGGSSSGIRAINASVSIKNSIIRGNLAGAGDGGGLNLQGGAFEISDNIVSNNAARQGGAIWLQSCTADVDHNLITYNSSFGVGAGLLAYDCTGLSIHNNTICNNDHSGDNTGALYSVYNAVCLQTNLDTLYLNLRDTFSISKSFRF